MMNLVAVVPLTIIWLTSLSSAKRPDVRIIGGTFAPIEKFPFAVVITTKFKDIYSGRTGRSYGGGSIIDPRWVITAAHVVFQLNKTVEEIAVIGGVDQRDQLSRGPIAFLTWAKAYFVHENYNYYTDNNDIGLIRLSRQIKYNQRADQIRLPRHKEEEYKHTQGTAVGFGRTHENATEDFSDYLMQVDLNVFHDHQYCSTNTIHYNSKAMLCAGIKEGGKDTCFGDSGYPFVIRRTTGSLYLAGITSFSTNGCARSNTPAFYVRVSSYLDWIKRIMDNNK